MVVAKGVEIALPSKSQAVNLETKHPLGMSYKKETIMVLDGVVYAKMKMKVFHICL